MRMGMISDIDAGRHGQYGGQMEMCQGALSKTSKGGSEEQSRCRKRHNEDCVVATRFPDLFPSNETRNWSHPCETDSLFLAQCQGNSDAPCPQNGKGWGQEEAKKKRGDVNIRLSRACCTVMPVAWQALSIRTTAAAPHLILQQQLTNQREGALTRRDLTSPHAGNTQQHLLRDTNSKPPTLASHVVRRPKSLASFARLPNHQIIAIRPPSQNTNVAYLVKALVVQDGPAPSPALRGNNSWFQQGLATNLLSTCRTSPWPTQATYHKPCRYIIQNRQSQPSLSRLDPPHLLVFLGFEPLRSYDHLSGILFFYQIDHIYTSNHVFTSAPFSGPARQCLDY